MRVKEFSVANFRSFNKEQRIVFNGDSNVSAIFGPNGSGKTNFFLAMLFYLNFIHSSTQYKGQKMRVEEFLLSGSKKPTETKFEMVFDDETFEYKYGFHILNHKISDEYLQKRQFQGEEYTTIFRRKSIKTGRYNRNGFDVDLLNKTRNDSLLLTKAWENNNKEAIDIFKCLEKLWLLSGKQSTNRTSKLIQKNPEFKNEVLKFLKNADLYIQDVTVEQIRVPDEVINSLPLDEVFKSKMNREAFDVTTTHFVYNDDDGKVIGIKPMSLEYQESSGTRRMYELAFPIINSLKNGITLYIDEFELYLHPKECQAIIDLFNDRHSNPKSAQLIITTHATQIMEYVGRNNLYLMGKNAKEETIIGKIPKTIRKEDKNIEKKYLLGTFGSIPRVGSFK